MKLYTLLIISIFSFIHKSAGQAAVNVFDNAGTIRLGVSGDTNLYRAGAGQLQTDGSLNVVGSITASNIISAPITLNVPSAYADIGAAWTALLNKVLLATVTIQVTGTIPQPNVVFTGHPTPHMIQIIGNTATPSAVVINQIAPGVLFEFVGAGGSGITWGGLTINSYQNTPSTNFAFYASYGATVVFLQSAPALSIVVQNFNAAVYAEQRGSVKAAGQLSAIGCTNGIETATGAYVDAASASITGATTGLNAIGGSRIDAPSSTISAPSGTGVSAVDGASVDVSQSTISAATTGLIANEGSRIKATSASVTITSTGNGVYALAVSSIDISNGHVNGVGSGTGTGVQASYDGHVNALSTAVQNWATCIQCAPQSSVQGTNTVLSSCGTQVSCTGYP